MNTLDLFLAALLGLGIWRGFATGAIRQVFGVAGWLLAFVLGTALMGGVGATVVESLGASPRLAPVLGFVVVFGLVLAAVAAVGHAFRKALEAIKLGGLDKLLGGGLSGLKAALSLSVFLLVTGFSPLPGGEPWLVSAETREGSLLYEPVRATAPAFWQFVRSAAPGVQRVLADKFNNWDEGRRARAAEAPPADEVE